jgi:hypothetical protein
MNLLVLPGTALPFAFRFGPPTQEPLRSIRLADPFGH